jgi:hypothetical protein
MWLNDYPQGWALFDAHFAKGGAAATCFEDDLIVESRFGIW